MDEMVRAARRRRRSSTSFALEEASLPDLERLASLVTPRTKAMFVNTPSNPTGAVFPGELVEELVELARPPRLLPDRRRGVRRDGARPRPWPYVGGLASTKTGRVISVYSFSKVYAMTGWRLGYCVASPALADLLRKLQEPEVSCPSAISQKAAEAALRGPQDVVAEMRDAYRERRDRAWELDRASAGCAAFRTQGTFYMLVDVSAAGMQLDGFHAAASRRGGSRRGAGRACSGRPARARSAISLASNRRTFDEGIGADLRRGRGARGSPR